MKYLIGTIFLLALLKSSLCDIPVHCLKSQIAGKWKIFASVPTQIRDLYQFTCGHSMPSHERNAYTQTKIIPKYIFSIDLQADDKAVLTIDNNGEKV